MNLWKQIPKSVCVWELLLSLLVPLLLLIGSAECFWSTEDGQRGLLLIKQEHGEIPLCTSWGVRTCVHCPDSLDFPMVCAVALYIP